MSRKELGGEEQGRNQGKEKESSVGDGLLSHAANRILPWALAGLTAGFEMGPGGPPPLISPTELSVLRVRFCVCARTLKTG